METTTTLYIDVRNPGIMQTIYAVCCGQAFL